MTPISGTLAGFCYYLSEQAISTAIVSMTMICIVSICCFTIYKSKKLDL